MKSFEPRDESQEDLTFIERHKVVLSVVAIVVIGIGVTFMAKKNSGGGSSRKGPELVSVRLPPPPPTPPPASTPPPPPPEMKQEQKMVEQAPVDENEEKPDDKPPDAAPVTTGIAGNGGADGFGLSGGRGNSMIGGANRQRSKWGWYAGMVQSGVGDVMRRDPRLRTASASLLVRIWADSTGRVTRAKVSNTASDPQLAQSVQDSLTGFQLKEAPPAGMPMPIVMKITAKRPN